MPFLLRYHPDVRKADLPLLDQKIKTQIRTAIEKRLHAAPQNYGEPLRKTLKGYWKLRVGNYRIVYKITGSEVLILGICHRRCLSENVGADVTDKRKADLPQQGNIYMTPIISIVGKSESGKTTLIEKLIPELKKRGYRIGTIKHALHGFQIDREGKDSWRHKAAGADTVIVASPESIAMVKNGGSETLDSVLKYFSDMDIVITEGYKRENKPKIEVFRKERHREPLCRDDNNLVALVTDDDMDLNVPRFGLEDIKGLADFIEKKFL